MDKQKPEKTIKKPKKITPRYLENSSAFYLQRFSSSSANLKRVMMRKIRKSCAFHGTDIHECEAMLDDVIKKYIESGILNDDMYTKAVTTAQRNRGASKRAIEARLKQKGVPSEMIDSNIDKTDQDMLDRHPEFDNPELIAAVRHIKRKRLGCFKTREEENSYEKDLARLARAGFSFDIAQKALNLTDEEIDF